MSWFRTICVALTISLMATGAVRADVKLPAIIGDNMLLQQGHDLPFWGWAEAGEQVSVNVAGKITMATTGADGRWFMRCPAVSKFGPVEVVVAGKNTITLKNAVVGDVRRSKPSMSRISSERLCRSSHFIRTMRH